MRGGGSNGGYRGGHDGGHRGGHFGGWGGVVGGIVTAIPQMAPPREEGVDDSSIDADGPPSRKPRRAARRTSNAPPARERRMVPDEVVIELRNTATPAQIDALQRRFRLARVASTPVALTGTTFYRWRIPDRRSVATVVRQLEADRLVASAQPNYQFTLQETVEAGENDAAQYELAKLHLPEAHAFAKGEHVLVAVIDSAIDTAHPDLQGTVAASFDATGMPPEPHAHGTAIAALIAGHGKLVGAAPAASILAVRAFEPKGGAAQGTTFAVLKGLDWAVTQHARVINMSFAGPPDPALHRALAVAHRKGVVLVAAAGNAGPESPPLYPAADPDVIAVTATDAQDKLLAVANRGRYIALAAPGADLVVAIPGGAYQVSSGTSYSAAEVSGIAALVLQRDGGLKPAEIRDLLMHTARDLGQKGHDAEFGAGLANAYAAVTAEKTPVAARHSPVEKVSNGLR
jgi:subtilisin family serine protease